jgi:hypothetical protein
VSNESELNLYNAVLKEFHAHLQERDMFPHEGQRPPLRAIFNDNKRVIVSQCGRSEGKTHSTLYTHWRACLSGPNKETYIICPELDQGNLIYWEPKRAQGFGPSKFISEEIKTQLFLRFFNGSFIKIEGSKNVDALRGIKPHLVTYDEAQKHSKEFHSEVMEPNMAIRACTLNVACTPPRRECWYSEFRKEHLALIAKGAQDRFYIELPSSVNPKADKKWLAEKKEQLYAQGDEKIWLREYEGKYVLGGEDAVFPLWDKATFTKALKVLLALVERDRSHLRWYCLADPGTSSVFAVLFACYNPYTSQLFLLDEIYERDRKKTDVKSIHEAIQKKKEKLYPGGKWINIYDEAEAWFQQEMQSNFREAWRPTKKQKHSVDDGISIIKTMMTVPDTLFVSDECKNLCFEFDNYVTDEDGEYPDDFDHEVDLTRYLVTEIHFNFREKVKPEDKIRVDTPQTFTPQTKLMEEVNLKTDDWTDNVVENSLYGDYFD